MAFHPTVLLRLVSSLAGAKAAALGDKRSSEQGVCIVLPDVVSPRGHLSKVGLVDVGREITPRLQAEMIRELSLKPPCNIPPQILVAGSCGP